MGDAGHPGLQTLVPVAAGVVQSLARGADLARDGDQRHRRQNHRKGEAAEERRLVPGQPRGRDQQRQAGCQGGQQQQPQRRGAFEIDQPQEHRQRRQAGQERGDVDRKPDRPAQPFAAAAIGRHPHRQGQPPGEAPRQRQPGKEEKGPDQHPGPSVAQLGPAGKPGLDPPPASGHEGATGRTA